METDLVDFVENIEAWNVDSVALNHVDQIILKKRASKILSLWRDRLVADLVDEISNIEEIRNKPAQAQSAAWRTVAI